MLTWIGILAEKTACADHNAREACTRMRDGIAVESDGIALVAIRMRGQLLAYGRIIQSLPDGDGTVVRYDKLMTARMLGAVERAMNRLGIFGPVEMYSSAFHENAA